MPTYDVFICAVVRVKVSGIEAKNHQEAIDKADEIAAPHELFAAVDFPRPGVVYTEYDGQNAEYLVEPEGNGLSENPAELCRYEDGEKGYVKVDDSASVLKHKWKLTAKLAKDVS